MDTHDILKMHAFRRLSVKNLYPYFEVGLCNGKRIDLFTVKTHQGERFKFGYECLTNPNFNSLKNKYALYKDYFDKLIFVIPNNFKIKTHFKNTKIWRFPINSMKNNNRSIAEIYCKDCFLIFYSDKDSKYCPKCNSTNIEIKSDVTRNVSVSVFNKELVNIRRRNNKITILKNPKFIRACGQIIPKKVKNV